MQRYELLPPPLMPLPPNPPELPPMPLPPELDETPALPRVPADTEPALRLAVLEAALEATDAVLLPTDAELTSPATEADLLVAALTRAVASAADLLVAATPPPVPDDWPETEDRAASSAVLRDAA